jgi:hypothetical protein
LKKNQGKEKLGMTWLARWVNPTTRLTRSKTQLQFIDFYFFFLLKRCYFDFKKKINPGDPSDPVKTWNPGLRPGRI